jgi:hypothetical protein
MIKVRHRLAQIKELVGFKVGLPMENKVILTCQELITQEGIFP